MTSERITRERIAVVGAGVAGLTAAYLLQRRHDVLLFEAEPRLGGHAHTHELPTDAVTVAVDSGFIVHNESTTRTCCGCSPNSACAPRTPTCR